MAHITGELLRGFAIQPEHQVIDVGCGDNTFIDFCARQGAEVTFVDILPDMVANAELRLKDSPARGIHGIVCDAGPLPLPDRHFDRVVCTEVIEHVDDPADFLHELVRIGKPGALFLLSVPDPASESVQKELAPPVHFEKPNHINFFTREAFDQLITNGGLIIENKSYNGFFWSIFWTFFWSCDQDLPPPLHPVLESWARTWELMLKTKDGPRIKHALDQVMPKSQVVIARKPYSSGSNQ